MSSLPAAVGPDPQVERRENKGQGGLVVPAAGCCGSPMAIGIKSG